MNFQMTNALMVRGEFSMGAQAYGWLGSVMGAGSLLGALVAARRSAAPRLRFVVGAAVFVGVAIVISGLAPNYLWYAAVLPIIGLAVLLALTAANMFIQTSVEPQVRGRVMALYLTLLMGGTAIGAPLLGWLAELLGPRAPLVGGGLLQLATIGVVVGLARRRPSGEHGDQRPGEHQHRHPE